MLHILLLILKIIGIILGVLIGTVLLCLILALFVPVRYQADVRRKEGEGQPPVEVNAKITWLLHIINIRLDYATQFRLRARIFLFTVFRLPKKQKKERKSKDKKKETVKTESMERTGNSESETVSPVQSGVECQKQTSEKSEEKGTNTTTEEIPEKDPEKQSKVSIKERIVKCITKIYQILRNIWYTIIGICDKIKKIRENIEYYWSVLQSDTFQKSFSLCKEELGSIFSYIRPRKFQADLIIGMDDPASTAKILSYYGMLYPLIGGNVNIVPDFDEKRIEGSVHIKGKIRVFTFIKAAVHIYFSKDIRKLLKLFKKEDA